MSIQRVVKIKLGEINAQWKGCYVDVQTKSFKETMTTQKEIRVIERQLSKLTRKIEKLEKKDDDESYDERVELEDKVDQMTSDLYDKLFGIAKSGFVKGQVLDDGVVRDMKVDDIEQFDMEVLKEIINKILGSISKND